MQATGLISATYQPKWRHLNLNQLTYCCVPNFPSLVGGPVTGCLGWQTDFELFNWFFSEEQQQLRTKDSRKWKMRNLFLDNYEPGSKFACHRWIRLIKSISKMPRGAYDLPPEAKISKIFPKIVENRDFKEYQNFRMQFSLWFLLKGPYIFL